MAPRVLCGCLIALLLVAGAESNAQQATRMQKQVGKDVIVKQRIPTPTPLESLQARVDELERTVEILKQRGSAQASGVGSVQRVPRVGESDWTGKGDSIGLVRQDIQNIWKQLELVMVTVDQLAASGR